MAESTIWWVLAGLVIGAELLTGTFYLLMLASGMVGAALAAHLGASLSVQIAIAAVLGGGSVAIWHFQRSKQPKPDARADVLDVGAHVLVEAWEADGSTQVKHRGANWRARPVPGATPETGPHRIEEVVGNTLLIRKI